MSEKHGADQIRKQANKIGVELKIDTTPLGKWLAQYKEKFLQTGISLADKGEQQ